LFNTR